MSKKIEINLSDVNYNRIVKASEMYGETFDSFIHKCINKQLRCIGV